jgi:hypothetical protein
MCSVSASSSDLDDQTWIIGQGSSLLAIASNPQDALAKVLAPKTETKVVGGGYARVFDDENPDSSFRFDGDDPKEAPGKDFGYAKDYGMSSVEAFPDVDNVVGKPIAAVRKLDVIDPDEIRRRDRAIARQTDIVSYSAHSTLLVWRLL